MIDAVTCAIFAIVCVGLFTALSIAVTEYYRARNAWSRFDAMMRERAASDPQSAARKTQG